MAEEVSANEDSLAPVMHEAAKNVVCEFLDFFATAAKRIQAGVTRIDPAAERFGTDPLAFWIFGIGRCHIIQMLYEAPCVTRVCVIGVVDRGPFPRICFVRVSADNNVQLFRQTGLPLQRAQVIGYAGGQNLDRDDTAPTAAEPGLFLPIAGPVSFFDAFGGPLSLALQHGWLTGWVAWA